MKAVVEGLLFLCGDEGLTLKEISTIINKNIEETKEIIKDLYNDYSDENRGINIEYLGERFKLTTKAVHKEYYKKLAIENVSTPLSESSLEVLAIIAYNGPITRIEIDDIRGVNSTYLLRKLLIRGLIEDAGKSNLPGHPKLYKVTNNFLDYFGLGDINELPKFDFKINTENDEKNLFESKYNDEI